MTDDVPRSLHDRSHRAMTTRTAALPRSLRRGDVAGIAAIVLLWAIGMAALAPALRAPAHVERLTVDNPTEWRVNVDVSDEEAGGWVGLGSVDRGHRYTFAGVLDQGETWIFTFRYAGQHAELRLSRHQLEQAGWQVTVPADLARRLQAAAVPETPS
jgi:hypothetical protein